MSNPQRPSLFALLFSTMLIGGCYSHFAPNAVTPIEAEAFAIDRVIENIEYSAPGWPQALRADLYLPERRGLRPVVLTVHGGSWSNRSRADMDGIGKKLARRGYAVLNVDYRFAPDYRHPAQIRDLGQALQWIRDHAAVHRLDITRINAWGFSSGAHLAALLAAYAPDHPARGADPQLPPIRAVVAGGIPSDLRKYDDSPIVKTFLGGYLHEMPERYAQASPAYHISADDPPVFLYHGSRDSLVTPDQARDYHAALIAAGIEAELYLHRWLGHTTLFLFGGHAEDKAIDFLDRHNADPANYAAAN